MAQQPLLQLRVESGAMQGTVAVFPVKKKVTIGRTRANAFPIKHDTVSQRHAFIACKNGQWFVTDSNSSNGTSINGVFLDPGVPTEVRDGDCIGIGPENDVSVKISSIAEVKDEQNVEESIVSKGEERRQQELRSHRLTLKEWVEHEKEHLREENECKAETSAREMREYAEAVKKQVCETAGVEYSSVA